MLIALTHATSPYNLAIYCL